MPAELDPRIRELAEKVIAADTPKRAILALKVLLDNGEVSTDDLNEREYGHPARVIGDIRDAGRRLSLWEMGHLCETHLRVRA